MSPADFANDLGSAIDTLREVCSSGLLNNMVVDNPDGDRKCIEGAIGCLIELRAAMTKDTPSL